MNDHFSPVGKPAPPRPRKPDDLISLMMPSWPFSISVLVLSQAPRALAPSSFQSWKPYRFLKMRSLSCRATVPRSLFAGLGKFLERGRPTLGPAGLPADLRAGLGRLSCRKAVEHLLEQLRVEVLVGVPEDLHHGSVG